MHHLVILTISIFLFSASINSTYAEEMEYCPAQFSNTKAHFYWPCDYLEQYELSWEGATRVAEKDNLVVADGDGYLTIHKLGTSYQTAPHLVTIEQGELITDVSLGANSFYNCLDNECSEVEIPLSGENQMFRGEVSFDEKKLDVASLIDGSVINTTSHYYQGMLERNMAQGIGKYCYGRPADGQNFVTLAESGDCPFPLSFQEGLWENGHFISGYSRILYETGGLYEGGFVNGVPQNWGKYLRPDHSNYFGKFDSGKRSGYGIYTYPDGSIYEGDWQEGRKHGEGILKIKGQGLEYVGEFNHGNIHGNGVIFFGDALSFIGQFINNAPHGEGIIVNNDTYYTAVFVNGSLMDATPIPSPEVTSFHFSDLLVSKAYAGKFNFGDLKDRITNKLKALADWVQDNKEHLVNAAKGCASGAAGGATIGASGGALAGAAAGSLAGGVGAVPGALAGAGFGAASGGINGCIDQAFVAFEYSKTHDGQYGREQMIAAIKAEFSTENFLYGALAGFGGAGGFSSLSKELAKYSDKVSKILETIAKKVPAPLWTSVKQATKIAEKIRKKLDIFDRGVIGITTWNMRILTNDSYQKRNKEVIKGLFRSAAPYTSVFALQEVFDKKVVVDMIYLDSKIPFFPYISKPRKWGNTRSYYYVFLVNPLTRLINRISQDNMDWAGYDKKFSRKPYAITLKNRKYKAVVINNHVIFNYKSQEDQLDGSTSKSELTAKKRVSEIREMYKIAKRKFGVQKENIILTGDFNLETNNVFFAKFLQSEKLKSCLKAPLSLVESSSGGVLDFFDNDASIFDILNSGTTVAKKSNESVNSYDHALVNRGTLCSGAIHDLNKDYNGAFYKDVSDHLPVTFLIKLKETKMGKKGSI